MKNSLVVLTGAGISAESGIRTFRDSNGLWENHRIEDVASAQGFHRNPTLVHNFYNLRRAQLKDPSIKPNAAHLALAELEEKWPGDFLLVTQNVDDLHERAGSQRLLHVHGSLNKAFCDVCEKRVECADDLSAESVCTGCRIKGRMRPDIVWFGEMPYHMDTIYDSLQTCDLFISIGTSGRVYPAAGFARDAWSAKKIEVNLEASDVSSHFDEHYVGPASIEVPKLVRKLFAT